MNLNFSHFQGTNIDTLSLPPRALAYGAIIPADICALLQLFL
jgi:hypothetical protein